MIDTLLRNREQADRSPVLEQLGLVSRGYAALTLHRPSNVDDPRTFGRILDALERIQRELPIVFPVHPRTRRILEGSALGRRVQDMPGLRLIDPLGFLDFLKLTGSARLVLTDSGGIQEETTILGVPCLTLRENTERPVTVDLGSNRLVGTDPERILAGFREVIDAELTPGGRPPLWDGRAAERIVEILLREIPGGAA